MSERILRGGPVRARDLRVAVREMGFENGIIMIMERFLDEFTTHRQQQRDMVTLLDQCINQVTAMVEIGTSMRDQLTKLKRERDLGEEIDHAAP